MNDIYKVYFLKRISGIPSIVQKKTIKPTEKNISYGNQTYKIDLEKPFFRLKNKFIILIDCAHGQMTESETDTDKKTELNALIFKKEIIKQLTSGLTKSETQIDNWILLIISIVAGGAIGYILGNYIPL